MAYWYENTGNELKRIGDPSDTQLTHLFNTLSVMGMRDVENLYAALMVPDYWPMDYWDAYELYGVALRESRLTGWYLDPFCDAQIPFSLSADKARSFVADYQNERLRELQHQHPDYAAREAARIRKLKKQWRQVQLSGKMWPMP